MKDKKKATVRKNQVTIKVMQVLPKETELDKKIYEFEVYADSNNVFEALAAANFEVLNELHQNSELPSLGRRGITLLKNGTIQDNFGRGKFQNRLKGYEEKIDLERGEVMNYVNKELLVNYFDEFSNFIFELMKIHGDKEKINQKFVNHDELIFNKLEEINEKSLELFGSELFSLSKSNFRQVYSELMTEVFKEVQKY